MTDKAKQIKYIEPAHEKMALVVFRFWVLQISMSCPLLRLELCIFAWSFLWVPTTCMQIAKALARLLLWAGSSEPLLVTMWLVSFSHVLDFNILLTSKGYLHSYIQIYTINVKKQTEIFCFTIIQTQQAYSYLMRFYWLRAIWKSLMTFILK